MLKDDIQGFKWFSYFLPCVWAAEIIITELGQGTLIVVRGTILSWLSSMVCSPRRLRVILGIAIHTFHDTQWPNPSQDNRNLIFVCKKTPHPAGILCLPAAAGPTKPPEFAQNIFPFGSPLSLAPQGTTRETHHNISPPCKISAAMHLHPEYTFLSWLHEYQTAIARQ